MTDWLSPEWVSASSAALRPWPGAVPVTPPVILSVTVTGGPEGDVRYERRWGTDTDATGEERQLALTIPAPDARAVLTGDLSPSVAFMRGRIKTSGDAAAVLEVLAATADTSFPEALARVRNVTNLPGER